MHRLLHRTSFLSVFVLTALVTLSTTIGCRGHVAVPLEDLPPTTAPLVERVEVYERLRPSPLGNAPRTQPGVLLANGTIVADPHVLAATVNVDGDTKKHAEKVRELDDIGGWLIGATALAGVLAVAGEVAGGAILFSIAEPGAVPAGPVADLGFGIAIGSAIAGGGTLLALMVPAIVLEMETRRERDEVFKSYDEDLRKRLALVEKK